MTLGNLFVMLLLSATAAFGSSVPMEYTRGLGARQTALRVPRGELLDENIAHRRSCIIRDHRGKWQVELQVQLRVHRQRRRALHRTYRYVRLSLSSIELAPHCFKSVIEAGDPSLQSAEVIHLDEWWQARQNKVSH